jgi:alkylation response protein AidB-like acyl-CoA dehydrogenase
VRLSDSRAEAAFRGELESWLDEHQPVAVGAAEPPLSPGHLPEWARDWQRTLFDAGWLMPSWPAGLGGRGAAPVEQLIYREELSRRHLPRSLNPVGLEVCVPVVVEHGTDDQRERWALPTLRGEATWCLAVGRDGTRPGEVTAPGFAVLERDGGIVVAGREPAPPGAQHADWCLCAAQVAMGGAGSGDVAVIVVDLKAPGVVRPLRADVGESAHEPDELIFDDVAVAGGDVMGDRRTGAAVAQSARAHERSARWLASLFVAQRALEALVNAGQTHGLAHDPVFRDTVAGLKVACDEARALAYRTVATEAAGRAASELAMLPLVAHDLELRVYQAGTELLGDDGLDLDVEGPLPWPSGAWGSHWLAALADTAAVNPLVERDRVAARMLGMPSR